MSPAANNLPGTLPLHHCKSLKNLNPYESRRDFLRHSTATLAVAGLRPGEVAVKVRVPGC
ncbi:MAG: twin-arginine translocation signal domain-containing protein [Bacteroidales bacterium]|nr:twin-arginine translocation signal domain-containing protein [Bacteroidales bacterium]